MALARTQSIPAIEKYYRIIRARRKFKAAVRLAFEFQLWLVPEGEMGDDFAVNIKLLVMKKAKGTSLNLQEKKILNTPKDLRTQEERKNLHRVLGGLKCFRRYPFNVKSSLAEVSYFVYYGPNRVLVRQNDEARALYFLLCGTVRVYQTVLDPILNEMVVNDLGVMEPGSMFGEISLLHGLKRTATITTEEGCEMLMVKQEDFDNVLKKTVLKEWDEIKKCMAHFNYFDQWDNMSIRECCMLSKIKRYSKDDIILGESEGEKKYVYFIVEGKCNLIEYINFEVSHVGGDIRYKLIKPSRELDADMSKTGMVELGVLDIRKGTSAISVDRAGPSRTSNGVSEDNVLKGDSRNTLRSVDLPISQIKISAAARKAARKQILRSPVEIARTLGNEWSKVSLDNLRRVIKLETHFMRVAIFNTLSTFNIGEHFANRYVVAVEKTKVLMIPRYWLVQKKKEVWNNIRSFLNKRLPDSEQIFEEYLHHRKWMKYRKEVVEEILSKCKKVNTNTIHNVPYSIRIKEDTDFKTFSRNLYY